MRLETTGSCGFSKARPRTTCANSSSIGSISGEWKAWLTFSRDVLRPCAAKAAAITRAAVSSPETTTDEGPLTAAMLTPSVRWDRTSSSVACTATIAPPAGSACISAARADTSFAASPRDSAPATCAAAISPTEWPTTKSGRTPKDSRSRNSATSTAKSAGWVNPVRFSVAASTSTGASSWAHTSS